MPDVTPVDFTTDVGRVRKYIPDLVQLPDPKDAFAPESYIWSDAAIQSFIADETDVTPAPRVAILRAAAYIMIATANNENLILKKLVTEDLQTDGPSVAKALIAAAQELLRRATSEAAAEDEVFLIVDYRSQSSYPQVLWGL